MNKILIALTTLFLVNHAAIAATPASQDWVKNWVTAHFLPITNTTINWSSLCLAGQSLTDTNGCTPNCTTGSAASTCNQIFDVGQVEQLSNVPMPYLSNGVVVFKLTQTGGGTGASFRTELAPTPDGYGYMCEILNANGSPATLWDAATSAPFPTSMITMDSSINPDAQITSDNYVSTVTQPTGGSPTYYWYTNPKNPLYMMCVSYQVTGVTLQSHAGCGGTSNTCITYSFA